MVPAVQAEAAVAATVKADHEATLVYVRQPVGETAAPINSYLALVADDPSVQIVSLAQLWYVKPLCREPRPRRPAGALGGGALQVGRARRA